MHAGQPTPSPDHTTDRARAAHASCAPRAPRTIEAASPRGALEQVEALFGIDGQILEMIEQDNGRVRVIAAGPDYVGLSSWKGDQIAQALLGQGVPRRVCDRLVRAARRYEVETCEVALSCALLEIARFPGLPDVSVWEQPIMLVGAPGAGKTTLAARLALAARQSGHSPALLSLDPAKAGARDQFACLIHALDTSGELIDCAEDLPGAIARLPAGQLAIVDNTGATDCDADAFRDLAETARSIGARCLLVQAAGGDPAEAIEIGAAAREAGIKDLIVTKIDTVRRLGSLVAAITDGGLALNGTTRSPWIADGVSAATPVALARLLLSSERQCAEIEGTFASLIGLQNAGG